MSSMEVIRGTLRQTLMASACALALAAPSTAQQHEHAAQPSTNGHSGQVHFPVACSPKAQQSFADAVAMLHSFHFPATGKAFTAITETEPDCAMARWGLAISQRLSPLVPPFAPEALGRGWQAIEHARAAPPRTERKPATALREFETSLRVAPNRYRSIAGAAKAAEGIGDHDVTMKWNERLLQLTSEADTQRPEMMAVRTFMAKN